MHHITDILIIGAGPVGIFTVFEAGMLEMQCHVVDALDYTGGQCRAMYPEKPIYDIPGYPVITADELIAKLENQALPFAPTYHLGQQVTSLHPNSDGSWKVETNLGTIITAKVIIVASGCGSFAPKKPPIQELIPCEGETVHYYVKNIDLFKDKIIAIAGGGDSATDWAISLSNVASRIYLIHRRQKFRCSPNNESQIHDLVASKKVELVTPYQLYSASGS